MRRCFAFLIFVSACFISLNGYMYLTPAHEYSIDSTIQNSRMIEAAFQIAQQHIDEFKRENMRFPSRDEFSEWTELHKEDLYSRYLPSLFLTTTDFPEDAVNELGEPPKDSYILTCWRGEWYEYYAPWNKTSTLEFESKNYYVLGGALKDGILFICIALTCLMVSVRLWWKPVNAAGLTLSASPENCRKQLHSGAARRGEGRE